MRRKPIARDEVRLSDRGNIATLPLDSVRRDRRGLSVDPIEKLWAPLVRELKQRQDADSAWKRKTYAGRFQPPKPIEVPMCHTTGAGRRSAGALRPRFL